MCQKIKNNTGQTKIIFELGRSIWFKRVLCIGTDLGWPTLAFLKKFKKLKKKKNDKYQWNRVGLGFVGSKNVGNSYIYLLEDFSHTSVFTSHEVLRQHLIDN